MQLYFTHKTLSCVTVLHFLLCTRNMVLLFYHLPVLLYIAEHYCSIVDVVELQTLSTVNCIMVVKAHVGNIYYMNTYALPRGAVQPRGVS